MNVTQPSSPRRRTTLSHAFLDDPRPSLAVSGLSSRNSVDHQSKAISPWHLGRSDLWHDQVSARSWGGTLSPQLYNSASHRWTAVFFDTPNRQNCQVKAARTNTPQHALTTLNDVTYVELAALLGRTLLTTTANDAERLKLRLSNSSVAYQPSKNASTAPRVAQYRAHFEKDPDAAKKLLSLGEKKRDEQLATSDHAAWTTLNECAAQP